MGRERIPRKLRDSMEGRKEMNRLEYVLELSKIIAVNDKVNLDKLEQIIDLNNKFYD